MTRASDLELWGGIRKQDVAVFSAEAVNELRVLVWRGEGQHLEFKRKASSGDRIVRELIAFANTSGGTLLIGVGDDKSIPGLKFPEDESLVVQQALAHVHPPLRVIETFIPIGGNRTVLQYTVEATDHRPHCMVDVSGSREYFIRSGDKSITASREMREIIRRRKKNRGVRFHYGEHENFLMKYLETHDAITLGEFVAASGLKKFYASKKLVLLVLANVLRIIPGERGDQFALAFTKF